MMPDSAKPEDVAYTNIYGAPVTWEAIAYNYIANNHLHLTFFNNLSN